jgi:hypothetical protein
MKSLWAGVAVIGLLTVPASAGTRYDRNIDRAAAAIVAQKIGQIRGGFSFDAKLRLVTNDDSIKTGSIARPAAAASTDPWRDGLVPATEGKVSRRIF